MADPLADAQADMIEKLNALVKAAQEDAKLWTEVEVTNNNLVAAEDDPALLRQLIAQYRAARAAWGAARAKRNAAAAAYFAAMAEFMRQLSLL